MADLSLEPLPPTEAIRFFESKGYRIGFDWRDVWQQEHARAFTVAKVMRHDLLETIRQGVDRGLRDGIPFETFKKELMPKLQAAGWWGKGGEVDPLTGELREVQLGSPHRLRTIFDTNLRGARAAGRWERIERSQARRPFLRYSAILDSKTRPQHRDWHAVILPVDHPFWEKYYPPNGWNCRCTVQQLSQRDLDRRGWTVSSESEVDGFLEATREWENQRTGEVITVQQGIDPGFNFNIGKEHMRGLAPPAGSGPVRFTGSTAGQSAPAWPGDTTVRSSRLFETTGDDAADAERFLEEFGAAAGRPAVFTDRLGEPIAITEAFLQDRAGRWMLGRGDRRRSLLLMADTIKDPTEIWWHWERMESGEHRLRRTYLSTYSVDGEQLRMAVGVQVGKDGWTASTSSSPRSITALLESRSGTLAYRRGG